MSDFYKFFGFELEKTGQIYNNCSDSLFGKSFISVLRLILNGDNAVVSNFVTKNVYSHEKYFVEILFKKLRYIWYGHEKEDFFVIRFCEITNFNKFIKMIKDRREDIIYIMFIPEIFYCSNSCEIDDIKMYEYCGRFVTKKNIGNFVINQSNWSNDVEEDFNFMHSM